MMFCPSVASAATRNRLGSAPFQDLPFPWNLLLGLVCYVRLVLKYEWAAIFTPRFGISCSSAFLESSQFSPTPGTGLAWPGLLGTPVDSDHSTNEKGWQLQAFLSLSLSLFFWGPVVILVGKDVFQRS
jgi:hypothetical protein